MTTYYEYRTSSIQSHLDDLQKQRDSTIDKLKAATKYNDTQDLLKKYGGTPVSKAKPAGPSERKTTPKQGDTLKGGRTAAVPPPTANIPGRNGPATLTHTPQRSIAQVRHPLGRDASYPALGATPPTQGPVPVQPVSAEFAPNAFSAAPQYSHVNQGSRWYDRIMDVLLGEDETLPGARLALICSNCRLVNGQAPPGVKRLEDVGKWRCGGCGVTKYVHFIPKDDFFTLFSRFVGYKTYCGARAVSAVSIPQIVVGRVFPILNAKRMLTPNPRLAVRRASPRRLFQASKSKRLPTKGIQSNEMKTVRIQGITIRAMEMFLFLKRMVMKATILRIRLKARSQCNTRRRKGARSQSLKTKDGRLDQEPVEKRPAKVAHYLDLHSLGDNLSLRHSSQRLKKAQEGKSLQ